MFNYIWFFAVEHKNSSNQPEKVAEEASLPLETGETAPCSEAMEKEDCDEGEVRDSLKKLLQDKGSNHDIEDWIQVMNDEVSYK